jgi:hypothetical protein
MEGWSSMRCALTWSIWGTKYGRASFLLRVSAHHTDEIGYGGLLITPTTTERCEDPKEMRARAERNGYKNGTQYNGLTSQVVYGMLGTPTARFQARSERFKGKAMNPQEFANAMLPTPTATSDPKGGCTRPDPSRQRDTLAHAMHDPTHGKTSQLNPRFVAEMMGFPANWTELPFQSGAQNP